MKKLTLYAKNILIAALAAAMLCACGGDKGIGLGGDTQGQAITPSSAAEGGTAQDPFDDSGTPQLFRVYSYDSKNLHNGNGFLQVEFVQSDTYNNIMYYDLTTLQQSYFCKVNGCEHNNEECASFVGSLKNVSPLFVGDRLYMYTYKYYADDSGIDRETFALTRYNADGSGGETVLEGRGRLDFFNLFSDGEALYYAAEDGFTRLDLENGWQTIFSDINSNQGEFGTDNTIYVLGAIYNNEILCMRNKRITNESGSLFSYADAFERELFTLNPRTGAQTIWHTFKPGEMSPSSLDDEGRGYYVNYKTAEVYRFDIATGEHTMITDMLVPYNSVETREVYGGYDELIEETYYAASSFYVKAFGDWLILNTWILDHDDPYANPETKTYGYNMETGEQTEISFGNFFNGYEHGMMIWQQTPHGLLVTEESRAIMVNSTGTGGEPYNFESSYNIYALISLDDFVHSRPNFNTIVPVEYSDPL